jgi:hypothetical protein
MAIPVFPAVSAPQSSIPPQPPRQEAPVRPSHASRQASEAANDLVAILLALGALVGMAGGLAVNHALTMETSVESSFGNRVHNLALAHEQMVWLILGISGVFVGVAMFVTGLIINGLRKGP